METAGRMDTTFTRFRCRSNFSMGLKAKLEQSQALKSYLDFVDSTASASTGIYALLVQAQHTPSQRSSEHWDLHPVYSSETRLACLRICGWTDLQESAALDSLCQENEVAGLYTRSAMLAIMHFNLSRAILALKSGPNHYEALVALLETFQLRDLDERIRTLFSKLSDSEADQYIGSALLFLSGTNAFQILQRRKLEVRDRLAIACRFIPDSQLVAFVKNELDQCKESGDPHGVLLTGLSVDSVPIIEKYLRSTHDRETAAVLGVYLLKYKVEQAQVWIDEFTTQLNIDGLFEKRCLFDIEKNRMLGTSVGHSTSGQSLRCYMCGKSLGIPQMLAEIGHKIAWNELHAKTVLNHCAHCKKLLPKCALCLRPLSSLNPYSELSKAKQATPRPQDISYAEWVSWCQKCRHGGHVGHLMQWFEGNTECPVSGCSCRCSMLDEESV